MRLLQINTVAERGSTGKIAEKIGRLAIDCGWESWIAYGRGKPKSESNLIRIGNDFDMMWHGLQTRLLDRHGLASKHATRNFIENVKTINPDLIHLHNIHGYYLNYPLLFDFLKELGRPVVWTLHDCWPFTGHCAHFEDYKCDRWKNSCFNCPAKKEYPKSVITDRSRKNHAQKHESFLSLDNLTILTPSEWLRQLVESSFLSKYKCTVIRNGIDLNTFNYTLAKKDDTKLIIAVASVWTDAKGLDDLQKLYRILPKGYRLCIIGLTPKQVKELPKGITGITRTENQHELARLYSKASVFVNPTHGDTFPTTNIEALACGTPVVTYRTGGSPESVDKNTGRVIERGNIEGLRNAILELDNLPKKEIAKACRERAVRLFDQHDRFAEYINLYDRLLGLSSES